MRQNIGLNYFPDLLTVHKSSFCWFLSEGLSQELKKFSTISDLGNDLELRVYGNRYRLKKPFWTIHQARKKSLTHSIHLYILIEVLKKTKTSFPLSFAHLSPTTMGDAYERVKQKSVFLGEIPLMTNKGSFLINGCERVVVHQIIRSPGVYFKQEKSNSKFAILFSATIISHRGSWINFELTSVDKKKKEENERYDVLWVKVDKRYRIPIHLFLSFLEVGPQEINHHLKNSSFLKQLMTETEKKAKLQKMVDEKKILPVKILTLLDAKEVESFLARRLFNPKVYDLGKSGRWKVNKKLKLNFPLSHSLLTSLDVLKTLDYLMEVKFAQEEMDDIDSLSNRRIRCAGELMQSQFRLGLNRMERSMEEKLSTSHLKNRKSPTFLLDTLIQSQPVLTAMKEFFGSSPLSQFMDETNPLSELAHKRRVSALGPGGLNTDHVSLAARDIHPSQYGRLCPIETPEGKNTGLVHSLATQAILNEYGFLESPFLKVINAKVLSHLPPFYLNPEREKHYKLASADVQLNFDGSLEDDTVSVRYLQDFALVRRHEVDLVGLSPLQVFSIPASLIPFLEHDDANRALMGSNMQRQALPLMKARKPIVGTGLEGLIARDICPSLVNTCHGWVVWVNADQIIVQTKKKSKKKNKEKLLYKRYQLEKYRGSNQETCVHQKPIVWPGQKVKAGQVLGDGPSTHQGELALGQNLTVAYMPWEGYNYEDAILVSDRLVSMDLLTSIHIEEYEVPIKQTKLGPEELTLEIPEASPTSLRHLNKNALVHKGAFVGPGDVLVGKVAPKEEDLTPEERLLKAIFGGPTIKVEDTSFRLPKGSVGRVLDVLVFSKAKGDLLPSGTNLLIRIFIAELRKIKIGDKISGRHGNKGIISNILLRQDMPYLMDGTTVDVLLNPLGVPSRMNVGQLFECLLGLAGHALHQRFRVLPFDELYGKEASRILINRQLKKASYFQQKPWLYNPSCPGKVYLREGRTGDLFDNPILVGKSYILKLIHLVDDKIHARSTGPYSLITQQPLKGKSYNGGQRFGEMEVWALEAFGAAYTLQEILTFKSDDIQGRNDIFYAIIVGEPLPKPGIPESFKVVLRELQALALDIQAYKMMAQDGQSHALEIPLRS